MNQIFRELVDHYCHLLDTEGDDFWWTCPIHDLAPPHLLTKLNININDIERGQVLLIKIAILHQSFIGCKCLFCLQYIHSYNQSTLLITCALI